MTRTSGQAVGVAAMAAVLAVGGCTTLQKSRDRIVQSPVRCEDQTAQIYFEADSADVSSEGRAVLMQAANNASGCTVRSVSVLGLADAAGDPNANFELSRKRAQSVTAALAAARLPPAQFHVAAAGQAGATNPDGKAAVLRRRADVILHLAAPK